MADSSTTRTFNLLRAPWIPVRRRSGRLDWIRPAEIADADDPPMALESSRPDFDAGLLQFLIALLQTFHCPGGEDEWADLLDQPPTVQQLDALFVPHQDVFWLDGPGPRYMQEQGLARFTNEAISIQDMLSEALASRLFFKADELSTLGLRAAAMALTTVQMHAWSGGRGYKTALRGAGAVSTVLRLEGATLFQNVWLNVLSKGDWEQIPGDGRAKLQSAFPWMEPERAQAKEQQDVARVSNKSHRAVHFWATSRRYWLQFGPAGSCDVLDAHESATVSTLLRRPYGLSYEGLWLHPLSPHKRDPKDQSLFPARVTDSRIPYKEWAALMLSQRDGETTTTDASAVVRAYRLRHRAKQIAAIAKSAGAGAWRVGMHIFGFQMPPGQAKVFGWLSQQTPFLGDDEKEAERLSRRAAQLIAAAESVRGSLFGACRAALRRRAEDLDYKVSVLQGVSRAFWSRTEPDFVAALEQFRTLPSDETEAAALDTQLKESWLRALQREAIAAFFDTTRGLELRQGDAGERVAKAHNKLVSDTSVHVPWLREAVGLEVTKQEKVRAAKSKPSQKKPAPSVRAKRGQAPEKE